MIEPTDLPRWTADLEAAAAAAERRREHVKLACWAVALVVGVALLVVFRVQDPGMP